MSSGWHYNILAKVGPRGKANAQTFNFLIVDAGKGEERVEYSVFEELGEEFLSEALDGLVCTE